jgi:hypothetical protein
VCCRSFLACMRDGRRRYDGGRAAAEERAVVIICRRLAGLREASSAHNAKCKPANRASK